MSFSKRITSLLIIIICITPLIIIPFGFDYFYFPKILFIYAVSSVLAVFWLLNRLSNNLAMDFTEKLLIIYIMLIMISTIFSIDISRSIWGIPRREEGLFAIIVYAFIFIAAKRNFQFSEKHVMLVLLTVVIIALYGIIQYFGYDIIPRDSIRMDWKKKAFSTMGNPNFLGTYLTLIIPISTFSYIYSKRLLYLFASGIIYLSLLCTLTRGAWLGSLVSIIVLVLYIFKYKYSIKHLVIIMLLFCGITMFFNIYTNGSIIGRFLTIPKAIGTVLSQSDNYARAGANRIFIWERVGKLILKKPILGFGLETLDIAFTEAYRNEIIKFYGKIHITDKTHNEYLHIAVSTGIPSLILYLTFVCSIVHKAIRNVKNNPLIIPLLCSVIGYLVQAFFNISVVSVAYIYWIFLGILMKLSIEASGTRGQFKGTSSQSNLIT